MQPACELFQSPIINIDVMIDNGLLGAPLLRTNWKWIRLHENICYELKGMGQFSELFSDILRRLLDSYYAGSRPGEIYRKVGEK